MNRRYWVCITRFDRGKKEKSFRLDQTDELIEFLAGHLLEGWSVHCMKIVEG